MVLTSVVPDQMEQAVVEGLALMALVVAEVLVLEVIPAILIVMLLSRSLL